MKKLLFTLFIFASLVSVSCTKETGRYEEDSAQTEISSLESFSIILSKALYAEPDLRYFFREEALKKTDYDYDVFYPYVKEQSVDGNRTVEDILSQYDSEGVLPLIEDEHPLLTVLVPDWSWVNDDCFSVNNWDCSIPDVGVSFLSEAEEHEIYWNGEYAFTMRDGEFSSAPILIVKDNDRLVADAQTKGRAQTSYSFFAEDFTDLSTASERETKAASSKYYDYDLPYVVANEGVISSLLTHRTATAYNACVSDSQLYQRDHIYYGMTSHTDTACVNCNYYETLYRFKLSPNAMGLWDNPEGSGTGHDFRTKNYYYQANTWGNATKLTIDEIKAKSWGEGAIELIIRVYVGGEFIQKNLSVNFADAFYVKKVQLRENYNVLGALKSRTYYLGLSTGNYDEWLEPKWITANFQLFYWDLTQFPTRYIVEFEEYDQSTKETRTRQESNTFTGNVSLSYSPGSWKFGAGVSINRTVSNSYTYETTQASDGLGRFYVQYTDKVILNQNYTSATIKTYTTGSVDVQIIPIFE